MIRAALYARYSTDMQRKESIEDQHRVCERLAERHGFAVVARFSDRAISGGTAARPGYQQMLVAARNHEFDVIVAEDTSRLWRNLAEQSPRLAELSDLGMYVVTHDLDTRHESAEIMGAVGGAMASAYRKEIGRRTRRGLEGKARAGKSAGGKSYGYTSATHAGKAQRVIDPEQAATVVRIFEMYAAGMSPRSIAAKLNSEGVPSPGASWNRTERRTDRKWMASAIHCDPKRGSGILNNDTYRGVVIWNRLHWIRSAADSAHRRAVVNPRSEWIEQRDEALRIVSDALWQRVKARQEQRGRDIGVKVKTGLRRHVRPTKYLLSGLLRCAACEAAFVLSNGERYQCVTHVNGDACDVVISLPRDRAERIIMECVQTELLSPAKLAELEKRYRSSVEHPPVDHSRRIAELDREVHNIGDAIAKGLVSEALASRLQAAEADRARLIALQQKPTREPGKLSAATIERRVEMMRKRLAEGGEIARGALREVLPNPIWLEPDVSGRFLWATFRDGVGAALFEREDVLGSFPIVGKVGECGSGGALQQNRIFVSSSTLKRRQSAG
jgi:site-specific DNA recombinase